MSRPPVHKTLKAKHHICTWKHARGSRGLYAEQRGQFVQAQITGYAMKPRYLIAADWMMLGWQVSRITEAWGAGWFLSGVTLRKMLDMPRNTRAVIEARS